MKLIRFGLLLIHLGIIALLLANYLNAYLAPSALPYLNFLALAFPVLMILNILLIIYWILAWKIRAFLFIILSLFLLKPCSRIVNFHSPDKTAANLKVITFNVHSAAFGVKEIEDFINKENPDILFLQEAGSVKNDYNFTKLPFKVKSKVVFFYSKYKILAEKDWINNENAYAKSYDIEINGKTYRFINTYLQPFYLNKNMVRPTDDQEVNEHKFRVLIKRMVPTFKDHQSQIADAYRAIEQSPYPIFLAGDFNSVPNSYEYYHLGKNLTDVFQSVGNGSGTSFHDYKFPIKIDYIFTSPEVKAISYKVDRRQRLSDHFPVIATFKLP